jgi:hypothetical protein
MEVSCCCWLHLFTPPTYFFWGSDPCVCVCVYKGNTREQHDRHTKGRTEGKTSEKKLVPEEEGDFFLLLLLFLETYTHDGCSDGGLSFLHLFVHGRRVVEL